MSITAIKLDYLLYMYDRVNPIFTLCVFHTSHCLTKNALVVSISIKKINKKHSYYHSCQHSTVHNLALDATLLLFLGGGEVWDGAASKKSKLYNAVSLPF